MERRRFTREFKLEAKHKRILHRVDHLIELVRVKSPTAQANKVRVRSAGWSVRTIGPGPVRNLRLRAVYAWFGTLNSRIARPRCSVSRLDSTDCSLPVDMAPRPS